MHTLGQINLINKTTSVIRPQILVPRLTGITSLHHAADLYTCVVFDGIYKPEVIATKVSVQTSVISKINIRISEIAKFLYRYSPNYESLCEGDRRVDFIIGIIHPLCLYY